MAIFWIRTSDPGYFGDPILGSSLLDASCFMTVNGTYDPFERVPGRLGDSPVCATAGGEANPIAP